MAVPSCDGDACSVAGGHCGLIDTCDVRACKLSLKAC